MHVMIDIETLGTRPDAVVLSVAAVAFDEDGRSAAFGALHLALSVEEQLVMGRSVDAETRRWWAEPERAPQFDAICGMPKTQGSDAMMQLDAFLAETAGEYVWSKGNNFDPVILADLCRQLGRPEITPFWRWRDVRTALTVTGVEMPPVEGAHDALADAIAQADAVARCLSQPGRKGSDLPCTCGPRPVRSL